jgi:hypothetical protein
VRQRPTHFIYTADGADHTGRNGVEMELDAKSGRARMEVWIEGQTVRIDTQNTTRLRVVTGPGGLGLSGRVTILWNQAKVCEVDASDQRVELELAPAVRPQSP